MLSATKCARMRLELASGNAVTYVCVTENKQYNGTYKMP